MADETKTTTVEIATPEASPVQKKAPTREELKESGWSEAELSSAEKHNMVSKPEDKKEDKKPEPKAEEISNAEEKPKEEVAKDEKKDEKPEKRISSLPDFTINDPEKEKVFLDTFGTGTPQRAMYFRMKHERQLRQATESRNRELEARLIESTKPKEKVIEKDEEGNDLDPDDKPMTLKAWKEMQRQENEERQKQDQELRAQGQVVKEAIKTQEEYARSLQPDFDNTVKLSTDLIQNLDDLVPDIKTQKRIIKRFQELQVAAANADKLGLDDENAADIAYELGKFHPNYGKSTNGQQPGDNGNPKNPDTKANGSHTPEQMKRIADNTQRRMSSASIPGGGGKRTISVEDVGLKELNDMNSDERFKFKTNHPDRYSKLMRG
jgi:hypothetical protein